MPPENLSVKIFNKRFCLFWAGNFDAFIKIKYILFGQGIKDNTVINRHDFFFIIKRDGIFVGFKKINIF